MKIEARCRDVFGKESSPVTSTSFRLNNNGVPTIVVSQTPTELIDAMKAKPGEVKVATAGVTSAGHNAMEAISRATGVKYRHVTYDGGNPAVVATVAGETDLTTQLAVEQAEMIRGKKLRALAAARSLLEPGGRFVFDVFSPGTSDCGTARSSIGHTGLPVMRSNT